MEKIKLTKREYLGEGYSDTLKNLETGEFVTTLCTKEQYGTYDYPEVPEGFEYVKSEGGFPLLDSGVGQEGDGFVKDGVYFVYEIDPDFKILTLNKYSEEEFNSKYIWQ